MVGRQTIVARERQLGASAKADPVDGRDRRDGQSAELREDALAHPRRLLTGRGVLDLCDRRHVRPGDEALFATADDERSKLPGLSARFGLARELGQSDHDRLGEDVHASLGIVEREPAEAVRIDLQARIGDGAHGVSPLGDVGNPPEDKPVAWSGPLPGRRHGR